MGAESQQAEVDHEHQMIQNLIKNIQLESPAAEPLKASSAQPSTPLSILPGQDSDAAWGIGVSVAPPTPEQPTQDIIGTPQSAGRSVPRPLSADLLAAGPGPGNAQQQRAATPTAQGTTFSDSPQAPTHGIVLLPGTNIPAHMQDTLHSPSKPVEQQQQQQQQPPYDHSHHAASNMPYHGYPPPEEAFHHHHLQHLNDIHAAQYGQPPGVYPVWDNGQLVGYVRMGEENGGYNSGGYNDFTPDRDAYNTGRGQHPHLMGRRASQEEAMMGMGRTMELADLKGRVVDFSRDQEGSRFIQKQITMGASEADLEMLFQEVYPHLIELTTDVFGNYVVQKLLEHGGKEQVANMGIGFEGHILELSLQTYGCRVVQKALEVMPPRFKEMVASELRSSVPRCVQDQNGNHVIQKCIEAMPLQVGFIVYAFSGNVHHLATHAYGCRVIQRLLEHCKDTPEVKPILNEILLHIGLLVQDQYGNYVVQDMLIHGDDVYRKAVAGNLRGKLMELSKHKFASNVVEKLFQYGTNDERYEFLNELMTSCTPEGYSALLCMVKDQFANYVVQKLLDLSDIPQRVAIVRHIRPHAAMLRKYTYGKHIMARIDRLAETLPKSYDLTDSHAVGHGGYVDPMSA